MRRLKIFAVHAAAAALTFGLVVSDARAASMPTPAKAEASAQTALKIELAASPLLALLGPAGNELHVRDRTAVPAQRRSRPRTPDWSRDRGVRDACDRAMRGRGNARDCLEAVRSASFDPTNLIRQCNRAVRGDRATLSCLRSGASARTDPSAELTACNRALTGDRSVLRCFDQANRARYPMRSAIQACDRALSSDDNKLRCVELASSARRDASGDINQCARRSRGERSTLHCIEREVSSPQRRR